jgi:hypothetical protein
MNVRRASAIVVAVATGVYIASTQVHVTFMRERFSLPGHQYT